MSTMCLPLDNSDKSGIIIKKGACGQAERELKTPTLPDLDNANVGKYLCKIGVSLCGHTFFSSSA